MYKLEGLLDTSPHSFFFNDTATTEIYTLSLHDALPICLPRDPPLGGTRVLRGVARPILRVDRRHATKKDRKSTRLNSSHSQISYAVFCLKKKNRRWTYESPRCSLDPIGYRTISVSHSSG